MSHFSFLTLVSLSLFILSVSAASPFIALSTTPVASSVSIEPNTHHVETIKANWWDRYFTTKPPTTKAPTTRTPTTVAPTTKAPTTVGPTTAAPTIAAPTTAAPTTAAPTTAAPSTAAPSTAAPSTAAPSTAAPSTAAPTTAAPTTAAPTTAAPTTTTPTLLPPVITGPTLDSEERAFVTLINNYRQSNGLVPLQVSITLSAAADWHNLDMATKNYFSHTDSLNRDPFVRMVAFGYPNQGYRGENIAAGNALAVDTFNQWKNSPGHNANMLKPEFRIMGISRVYLATATYRWYWGNNFGSVIDPILV